MIVPLVEELEHPLTPREIEILRLIAEGLTNPQISEELGISIHTIKTHLTRAFVKLGVDTRSEAVAWAFRAGVLS